MCRKVVLAIVVFATAQMANAATVSLHEAINDVHITSAGKLVRITYEYSHGTLITEACGSDVFVAQMGVNDLFVIANVICDFNKTWRVLTPALSDITSLYCIAK